MWRVQLHQIMPAVLTCVVGKKLCVNTATDNHWVLRDFAASLVATLCSRYVAPCRWMGLYACMLLDDSPRR